MTTGGKVCFSSTSQLVRWFCRHGCLSHHHPCRVSSSSAASSLDTWAWRAWGTSMLLESAAQQWRSHAQHLPSIWCRALQEPVLSKGTQGDFQCNSQVKTESKIRFNHLSVFSLRSEKKYSVRWECLIVNSLLFSDHWIHKKYVGDKWAEKWTDHPNWNVVISYYRIFLA